MVSNQRKIANKQGRGRPKIYENDAARQRARYWRKKKEALLAARKDRDEWETPEALFQKLNSEFNFDLDCCASVYNFKCDRFYTLEAGENGLTLPWTPAKAVWCNCPYSQIAPWVKRASNETRNGITTVMLIPSSTGTSYWHRYIQDKPNVQVRFLPGRVKFVRSGAKGPAPFDSAIVIFRSKSDA